MDLDTLQLDEQLYLRLAAADLCPTHDFAVKANADGQSWVVLEPAMPRADLPRFTICRVDPSVMVLVENSERTRRFIAAASLEDAMHVVRTTADEAVLAAIATHPAHPVPQ